MSDESALRDKAREAIRAGALPDHRPERMWGGPGARVACAVCGELVRDDQLGFELEFAREERKNSVGVCAVHVRCLAAWGVEELHLLNGELWINDRKLYPGDYHRAEAGTADRRVWSETGCTCVLITSPHDTLRESPRQDV